MTAVHNEQTKLLATALNNVAVAYVVIGFVTPMTAVSFGVASAPAAEVRNRLLRGLALYGVGLHWVARRRASEPQAMSSGEIFVTFVIPPSRWRSPMRRCSPTNGRRSLEPANGASDRADAPRNLPLYFAYGANMDAAAMALRCPVSRLIGRGRLAGHRFIVMREGYASVVRDPARVVHGVLWELALDDIPASTATRAWRAASTPRRACPSAPRRACVGRCLSISGARRRRGGRAGYLEAVLAAASAAQLPTPYLREIGGWLRGPPS